MIALALAFAVVGGAIVAPPLPIGTSPPAQAPPAAVALPQIADFAYCRRSVGYKSSEDPEGRCSAGAGPRPNAHRARPFLRCCGRLRGPRSGLCGGFTRYMPAPK